MKVPVCERERERGGYIKKEKNEKWAERIRFAFQRRARRFSPLSEERNQEKKKKEETRQKEGEHTQKKGEKSQKKKNEENSLVSY